MFHSRALAYSILDRAFVKKIICKLSSNGLVDLQMHHFEPIKNVLPSLNKKLPKKTQPTSFIKKQNKSIQNCRNENRIVFKS